MQGVRLGPKQSFVDQRVDERLEPLSALRTGPSQMRNRLRARVRQRSQQRAAWPRQLASPIHGGSDCREPQIERDGFIEQLAQLRSPGPPSGGNLRRRRSPWSPHGSSILHDTVLLTSFCQLDKIGDTCARRRTHEVSLAATAMCSTRRASVLYHGPAGWSQPAPGTGRASRRPPGGPRHAAHPIRAPCRVARRPVRPCSAQTPAVIAGTVLDVRSERPLAGVLVTVDQQPFFAETDAEGRFRIEAPAGTYTVSFRLIGYALRRRSVQLGAQDWSERPARRRRRRLRGACDRRRNDAWRGGPGAGRPGALRPRAQTLRGLMMDDPLRAVHSLPSVTATDDFYSEFAVRGSSFRHIGLTVDEIPTRYLMHTIQGATDGGSIAMVTRDAGGGVAAARQLPTTNRASNWCAARSRPRDGSRERVSGRVGLSGNSVNALVEGPLPEGRGSWLVSVRRSYLDFLISRSIPVAALVLATPTAMPSSSSISRRPIGLNDRALSVNRGSMTMPTTWG